MSHVLISCTFMALMIWHALNRLVFITQKIKIYPFDGFRITGGIHKKEGVLNILNKDNL